VARKLLIGDKMLYFRSTYPHNVWTRIKISFVIGISIIGAIGSVFTFPITYWFFGVSPMKIFEWGVTKAEELGKQIRTDIRASGYSGYSGK
jgi:hypothetical protein